MVGGTAAHRLIDHVDDVALLNEILGPALAAVGRAHPVGGGLSSAVDEHQRVGAALLFRRQNLDIDLALHDVLTGFANIMAADIEEAALGDGRLIDSGDRKLHFRARRCAGQRREQKRSMRCANCGAPVPLPLSLP